MSRRTDIACSIRSPSQLGALADVEGHDEVGRHRGGGARKTIIRWLDHGIPDPRVSGTVWQDRAISRDTNGPDGSPAMYWKHWRSIRTCADDSNRYAPDCIQLRGTVNKIAASDGHRSWSIRARLPWEGICSSRLARFRARCYHAIGRSDRQDRRTLCSVSVPDEYHEIQKDAFSQRRGVPDHDALAA
jgi:hypothetical protein